MPFQLTIVTPRGEAFRGEVEGIVLPGSEGDFGVLPEHERFLTPLRIGTLEIHAGDDTLHAAIAEGFAEVTGEQVSVLVDSCELASEIDLGDAETARDRAQQALAELDREADADRYARYEAALALAHARLAAVARR